MNNNAPWGRYAPYDDACAVLLARIVPGLPLPHFWSLEENEQKVTMAVVDNTPMTLDVWTKLSPPERVPWVEKATAAISKQPAAPTTPKTGKAASVNERMAADLQDDPTLVDRSAKEWAIKLGCSDAAVKQTATWKTIQKARAIHRAQ